MFSLSLFPLEDDEEVIAKDFYSTVRSGKSYSVGTELECFLVLKKRAEVVALDLPAVWS